MIMLYLVMIPYEWRPVWEVVLDTVYSENAVIQSFYLDIEDRAMDTGKVFITWQNYIAKIDVDSGEVLWKVDLDTYVQSPYLVRYFILNKIFNKNYFLLIRAHNTTIPDSNFILILNKDNGELVKKISYGTENLDIGDLNDYNMRNFTIYRRSGQVPYPNICYVWKIYNSNGNPTPNYIRFACIDTLGNFTLNTVSDPIFADWRADETGGAITNWVNEITAFMSTPDSVIVVALERDGDIDAETRFECGLVRDVLSPAYRDEADLIEEGIYICSHGTATKLVFPRFRRSHLITGLGSSTWYFITNIHSYDYINKYGDGMLDWSIDVLLYSSRNDSTFIGLAEVANSEFNIISTIPVSFVTSTSSKGYLHRPTDNILAGNSTSGKPVIYRADGEFIYEEDTGAIVDVQWYMKDTSILVLHKIGNRYYLKKLKHLPVIDSIPPAAPEIIKPYRDTVITETNVEFEWHNSNDNAYGVENYRYQLSTDSSFSSTLLDTVLPYGDTTLTYNLEEGIYYWRVNATDSAGNIGEWSVGKFRVDTTPPNPPNLVFPVEIIVGQYPDSLYFVWNEINDIAGIRRYEMEVMIDSIGSDIAYVVDSTADTTHIPLIYVVYPTTPDTQLYWRIRAKDRAGRWSSYSNIRTFWIDFESPTIDYTQGTWEGDSAVIQTRVQDNMGIGKVELWYQIDDDTTWTVTNMSEESDSIYRVVLDMSGREELRYFVKAIDIASPGNYNYDPPAAPYIYYTLRPVSEGERTIGISRFEVGRDGIRYWIKKGDWGEVLIYNVGGRLVHRKRISNGFGTISYDGFRNGVYVVKIFINNKKVFDDKVLIINGR